MNKLLSCHYNMDTNRVEAQFADGSAVAIDCIAIEDEYGNTPAQRAELDWLLYNKPLENQAALSSAFVRFSKPASVCRVTQGGDKTPSSAVLLFLPQRPGKGRHRRVSCTLPQMETPAV